MAIKTLSLVSFLLFTSVVLQSMNVNASEHACLLPFINDGYIIYMNDRETSCTGALMRWRYSPTDDVHGQDCIGWCLSFHKSSGVNCAQMNEDENSTMYCACYQGCP
ncbi:hypothetical protein MKW94_030487 [Papaver nudicaule]|uniref:Uncharacterized protein n=1 Tax=Papaver nudicaule TaxID=74823 RepID=A0AA41S330_PAPNU|nr:hypothetical protein [Papaver nudicaule]